MGLLYIALLASLISIGGLSISLYWSRKHIAAQDAMLHEVDLAMKELIPLLLDVRRAQLEAETNVQDLTGKQYRSRSLRWD